MNEKEIYLGIDRRGECGRNSSYLGELLTEEYHPSHFDLVDYHEPPKYVTNQDYYE